MIQNNCTTVTFQYSVKVNTLSEQLCIASVRLYLEVLGHSKQSAESKQTADIIKNYHLSFLTTLYCFSKAVSACFRKK